MSQAPTQLTKITAGSPSHDVWTDPPSSRDGFQTFDDLPPRGPPSGGNKASFVAYGDKSSKACETCRVKKVGCGNELPICRTCATTGRQCTYGEVNSRKVNNRKPRVRTSCATCVTRKVKCGTESNTRCENHAEFKMAASADLGNLHKEEGTVYSNQTKPHGSRSSHVPIADEATKVNELLPSAGEPWTDWDDGKVGRDNGKNGRDDGENGRDDGEDEAMSECESESEAKEDYPDPPPNEGFVSPYFV